MFIYNMSYQRQFYGLINLGNSCYLNATLQSLVNLYPLAKLFLSEDFRKDLKNNDEFVLEFYNFIKTMWLSEPCLIRPIKLKTLLGKYYQKFNNFNQQDANESLNVLLEMLHKGLAYRASINSEGDPKNVIDKLMIESINKWKNEYEKEYSKIIELFYGQLINKVFCLNCQNIIYSFDPFATINLPIYQNDKTIEDLLNNFFNIEKMDDYECEKCGSKNIQKKFSLWRLPPILILTFKRFNNNLQKNDQLIQFSLDNINLNKYLSGYEKNANYKPISLINHVGSLNGGHYYAYCCKGDDWYNCDDSNISKLNNVPFDYVYMVFLIKK